MDALKSVIVARSALVLDECFFGALALRLKLVENGKIPTCGTDGRVLGFNPKFINELSHDQLKGLICHEVLHVANGHCWRRDGRDFEDFNLACLAAGTRVEMADGTTRNIENISVGEYVASPEGISRVLGVMFSGFQPCLQIYDKSHTLVCTPDHQILTTKGLVYGLRSEGMSALQRGIRSASRRRRVCNEKLQTFINDRIEHSHRGFLSQRESIPAKTRLDGQSLFNLAMERARLGAALEIGACLFGRDYRWRRNTSHSEPWSILSTANHSCKYFLRLASMAAQQGFLWNRYEKCQRESLLSDALVRLSHGRFAALDPALFGNQKTPCKVALEAYSNQKKTTFQRIENGTYVQDCLESPNIESTRLSIRRGPQAPQPVFDLITEKTFIFAEGFVVHNCDFAIDPIIKANHMSLPPGEHINPRFAGLSGEAIYGIIHHEKPKGPQGPSGGFGGQGGQDDKDQDGECGDQRDNKERPSGGFGEVWDDMEEDASTQKAEWDIAVLEAAQAAQMQGTMPAGLERLIDKIKNPQINYKAAMRKFMAEVAKADYNWRKPNRRFMAQGLYMPQIKSEALGKLIVIIDTSGSISQRQLDQCTAEFSELIRETNPERVYRLYVDAEVQQVDEFEPGDILKSTAKGGGGTNLPVAWDWAREKGIEPVCALVYTDMHTPWGEDPGYPVLWITSTPNVKAPYGETLFLRND